MNLPWLRLINPTSIVSLGIVLACYILLNIWVNLTPLGNQLKMDVTEEGLYTLSQGTYNTLANIDEPIEFHFFFSEQLGREVPSYATYARRVREVLEEMEAASAGKLILYDYNPLPFSDLEDEAILNGIQAIPIDESDERVYFGLVGTNAAGDSEKIPFLQPEREALLEYDLTKMLHTLSVPDRPVVGVMSSLPILGNMRSQFANDVMVPWAMGKQLRTHYTVRNLPQTLDQLPSDIDVMVVIHPQSMTARATYELEQFLFRGGRALLFVDPKSESDLSLGPNATSSSTKGLEALFDQWGIRIPEGRLVADKSLALRINAGSASQPTPADYLLWLGVPNNNMAQDDPVSSQLGPLNIASSGFIEQNSDSSFRLTPLIVSSKNSSQISADTVRGSRPDILGLLNTFSPDDNTYVMAARLSGAATTAFPNGAPSRTIKPTNKAAEPSQLMQSNVPINLILVADTDLLEERFWLQKQQFYGRNVEQQIASNATFVINAISNLAGHDALLSLRSRGVSQRPFETVIEMQSQAEQRLQIKERELQSKLKEAQQKVAALEGVKSIKDENTGALTVTVSLTAEQRREVELLQDQVHALRKALRHVQLNLRKDVDNLESWLKFINIGLIPILLSAVVFILSLCRRAKRRRHHLTQ